MGEILFYLITIGVVSIMAWLGQWGRTNKYPRYLLLGIITLSGGGLITLGGLMMILPHLDLPFILDLPSNIALLGSLLLGMGCCAIPCLIPGARRLLSKTVFKGLDVSNPAHTWALYIFLAALVMTFFSITLLYDPAAILASLQNMSLTTTAVINAFSFVLFAFLGAGVWIVQPFSATAKQLGLGQLSWKQAGQMLGLALLLALFIQIFEQWLHPLLGPQMQETLHAIGEAMKPTGGAGHVVLTAIIVGISAGLGEEILFRGLMQPVFGLIPTTLLFTLVHTHYGPTILLLELFLIGLLLGWIRKKYNTTAAILVHSGFDFFALLSALLPGN